jgi:hypothetical protein
VGSIRAGEEIESDMRNMYVLGFLLPADARDGRFYKLEGDNSAPLRGAPPGSGR